MMYAEVGFQAIRLSFRDDATLFLFTLRYDGDVPHERAAAGGLLREKLGGTGGRYRRCSTLMSTRRTSTSTR